VSGFQLLVTLTFNRVKQHTVVHHSSTCIYIPNFTEIGKTFFLEGLTAGTTPSLRSRDTKTRTNFKNPARSTGQLPAPSINGGDRLWKVQFSELQRPHDLDLDLESGHTAYRRASFIDLFCTYQISLKSDKLFVDGRTDGHTYWRTDISPSNVIRSTRWSRPKKWASFVYTVFLTFPVTLLPKIIIIRSCMSRL